MVMPKKMLFHKIPTNKIVLNQKNQNYSKKTKFFFGKTHCKVDGPGSANKCALHSVCYTMITSHCIMHTVCV